MRKKVTVSKKMKGKYRYVVYYPDEGKRKEKYFIYKTKAEEFARERQEAVDLKGSESAAVSAHEMLAVTTWRQAQSSHPELNDISLEAVINSYLNQHRARLDSMSLSNCIDKLILSLQLGGKSKRHIETVESNMRRFQKEFPNWMMSDFTREQVFDYLAHMECSATTKQNHLRTITSLFNKALQLGVVSFSPVVKLSKELEKPVWKEPEVYAVEHVSLLLQHCPQRSLAAVVLGFFCGLRRAELERIDWKHIKLTSNKVTVPASIEKKSRRKVIEIPNNATKWLQPLAIRSGALVESQQCYRSDLEKMHVSANVERVNNGLRHSFCSYHVALHESADKTALLLGHKNASVLFDHYRNVVDKEEGHSYFNIMPTADDNIVDISA